MTTGSIANTLDYWPHAFQKPELHFAVDSGINKYLRNLLKRQPKTYSSMKELFASDSSFEGYEVIEPDEKLKKKMKTLESLVNAYYA